MKTLAREWTEVRARVVDFDLSTAAENVGSKLVEELMTDDGWSEVGYASDRRVRLQAKRSPLMMDHQPRIELKPGEPIILTGGARGITATIAAEVARKWKPTLLLLGRSPVPDGQESAETASITSPNELKSWLHAKLRKQGRPVTASGLDQAFQTIMQAREIRENLDRFRKAGSSVEYAAVNVRDEQALGKVLETWRRRHGDPVGLIHGAGVIKDKLIREKSADSFDHVLGTKLDGALNLARLLNPAPLRFAALFSSIAGRFGNVGQTDYAAANDVLNKLAVWLDRRWPGRVVSMNWGPWSGVGMVSELEGHLGGRGLGMIPPEIGKTLLIDELQRGSKGDVEIIAAGDLGTLDQAHRAVPTDGDHAMSRRGPLEIAIVGMACRFPGARDLCAFWRNIVQGVDAFSDVPANRWDLATFLDPASSANDRVACRKGGYLDAPIDFDPASHGIMPNAVDGGEPEQFLILDTARAALLDAGLEDGISDGRRVEVIIGRGNYFNRGNLTRLQHGRIVAQTLAILESLHPEWSEADREAIRHDLKASLPPFGPATIPGQLTNATAGRVANRLDLSGASYVVDAASAFVARGAGSGGSKSGRAAIRPRSRRRRLSRSGRRFPAGLPPAWRDVRVGPIAPVRERCRWDALRRRRGGDRPQAQGRRRA